MLLNRLLARPGGRRICVIENELGAVSIDHELLAGAARGPGGVVVLKNGCVCCSSAGGSGDELARTLDRLLMLTEKETPAAGEGGAAGAAGGGAEATASADFDYVVIETSGIVDPAPLVQAFYRSLLASARYRLDGVVAVVDAAHIGHHLDGAGFLSRAAEAGQQVAYADVVLLNKVDAATPQQRAQARRAVRAVNPAAALLECTFCEVDTALLLGRGSFDVARAAALLQEQLGVAAAAGAESDGDDW